MDAQHLPAVIGTCPHCGLPLYAGSPFHVKPDGDPLVAGKKNRRTHFFTPEHVACAVQARGR